MKQDILIADSGSTKTEWALGDVRVKTQGINPFHQDDETIRNILKDELRPHLSSHLNQLRAIYFYGSGVRPELEGKMVRLLSEVFPEAAHVEAHSDLLGAAIALCGHHEGIACILGTGANSCLFDGKAIVENVPPMGYILGDEGSGAVLGKRFLNALYKNRLPQSLREAFEKHYQVSLAEVIDRVYHIDVPQVEALVIDNFRDFLVNNVAQYGRKDLPVSAVGSIAYFYRAQLEEAIRKEGYTVGEILRGPLDGLVEVIG